MVQTGQGRGSIPVGSVATPNSPSSTSGSVPHRRNANRSRWLIAGLAAVVVIRLIVAAVAPVTDSTESRYAQIASEMVSSRDWTTPRLWVDGRQVPYLGKPPLFFWADAASLRVFGENEFAARLPSFVALTLLLAFMYLVLRRTLGPRVAESAVAITLSCGLVFVMSAAVIVDMQLTLFVSGALLAQFAFVHEADPRIRRRWSVLTFVLLAGGFLTKGPVAVILCFLPLVVWTVARGRWRTMRDQAWWVGCALFLVVVTPWFVVAELRNPGFLRYFFINENLLRYLSPEYGDLYGNGRRAPRGAAAVMFLAASLPWSPVAVALLARVRGRGGSRVPWNDVSSFLFIGFAVQVAFWCLARQPLITYLLPSIPLFAAWAAYGLSRGRLPEWIGLRLAVAAVAFWCLLTAVAIPYASAQSTHDVVETCRRVRGDTNPPCRIVFAGWTPSSAVFYGRERVVCHSYESIGDSVERALSAKETTLVAVREPEVAQIPDSSRGRLTEVAAVDRWRLFGVDRGSRSSARRQEPQGSGGDESRAELGDIGGDAGVGPVSSEVGGGIGVAGGLAAGRTETAAVGGAEGR